jgi:hypothetical protein
LDHIRHRRRHQALPLPLPLRHTRRCVASCASSHTIRHPSLMIQVASSPDAYDMWDPNYLEVLLLHKLDQ